MAWNVEIPKAEWYTHESPELEAVIREVIDQKHVAIDTETTGLSTWKDTPLFWSLSWGERRMCMPTETLHYFQEAFKQENKNWIFANAKFDAHMLANYGIDIAGNLVDTQVMHALLYEERPHGLKPMAMELLGWRWSDFDDTFKKKPGETIQDIIMKCYHENHRLLVEYAANDAYGTLKVFEKLDKELKSEPTFSLYPEFFETMSDLFWKTEVPFTKTLFGCERHGALLDLEFLDTIRQPVMKRLEEIEKEVVRIAGRNININSNDELRDYLVGYKKLAPLKLTKGGASGIRKASIDSDYLDFYKKLDPVAGLAAENRDLKKLLSTYVEGLSDKVDYNNRIHTRYNQDTARTGRLSSSEPNTQNIPNPEADRFKLRRAFIARPGYKLICLDYEALEMRLLAAASMEQDMIEIFEKGWDIHMGNAALVYGVPYEHIKTAKKKDKKELTDYDKKMLAFRQSVKIIGFGLNYGMKEKLLAANLGVSVEEAIEVRERYLGRYPAVTKFYEEAIEESRKTGCAYSVLGRRRRLPAINSPREFDRYRAERQAVNQQIQGSAADVVRMAMNLIRKECIEERYGAVMFLQVHDELLFECPEETAEEAREQIAECMTYSLHTDLAVKLTTSSHIVDNWSEAK